MSQADARYEHSRALLKKGDFDGALAAARETITLDPRYPNAHSFAGWILLQRPERSAADLEAAIGYFRTARELAPWDGVPLVNLSEALVAAGRADEAIVTMERALAEGALAAYAHNWLGCHFGFQRADVDRALSHLRAATRAKPWWSVPWVNLAALLESRGALVDAYVANEMAQSCSDLADKKQARKRSRELEAELQRAGQEVPLVMRGESGELLGPEFTSIGRACREGRFDEAIAALLALERTDIGRLVDATGIAERGALAAHAEGKLEQAHRLLEAALRGYRAYASWSTSGAEGTARMVDVERVQRLLASWESG
jgi:tetratricopeptide (TPR) repeat protein